MDADELEQCIDRLTDMEAKVTRSIYGHCQSLMEYKAIQTDKRARYNKANLLGKETNKKSTRHEYTVGLLVSFGGRKVTLNSLEPPDAECPTTCWVTDKVGKSLHVRVDSLRPLSADIDRMPKDKSWKQPDQFIIYDTDARISGGIIKSIEPASTTVHDYMPIKRKTCVIWGPLWIPIADDQAEPFRATKCPAAHSPYLVKINDADVVSRATLKGRRLDDDSIARLKALGHDIIDVLG
jgi:hypothetical protein